MSGPGEMTLLARQALSLHRHGWTSGGPITVAAVLRERFGSRAVELTDDSKVLFVLRELEREARNHGY